MKKYIVYTPDYTEERGGTMMLHYLCHLLNKSGCTAHILRLRPPLVMRGRIRARIQFYYWVKRLLGIPMKVNPSFSTPEAKEWDAADSIVIYPDIIVGNPLNAAKVVRWLLHKPGNRTGKTRYGDNDLIFYFRDQFNTLGLEEKFALNLTYFKADIYQNKGSTERSGSCYLLRKGKNREIVHDLEGSILIDGKSHEEIAEIFNKAEYCISYDGYTMYNKYAAMCGCIPIVVPEDGVTKEEWMLNERDRYGIAYGFDDIEYAVKTMGLVRGEFEKIQEQSAGQIGDFISITQSYFK